MLKEYCSICDDKDDDFVGIKFQNGQPNISFPRGYKLSKDEELIRKEILSLLVVLQKFTNHREGQKSKKDGEFQTTFPILSYQYVIKDFIAHNYYFEYEVEHKISNRGKVNWKRTIQQIQPKIDNGNVVYLNFISKRSVIKSNLITKIHEFCVYESFYKLGWLYLSNSYLPKKPILRFNKKMFLSVLNDALKNTFNKDKKILFSSMINIVNSIDEKTNLMDFQFGVTRFEYIWESLIDYVFGETNKEDYFPRATWHIVNGNRNESSTLEPDTIMKFKDKFFILDAKYYKFGITNNPTHLPATSSIQKQITYGDYIAKKFGEKNNGIYNAFIMPYPSKDDEKFKFVSVGMADWIKYSPNTENHKYVLGILLDTKYIIQNFARHSEKDILKMSDLIIASLSGYRRDKGESIF